MARPESINPQLLRPAIIPLAGHFSLKPTSYSICTLHSPERRARFDVPRPTTPLSGGTGCELTPADWLDRDYQVSSLPALMSGDEMFAFNPLRPL
jgi:hypothetical protein